MEKDKIDKKLEELRAIRDKKYEEYWQSHVELLKAEQESYNVDQYIGKFIRIGDKENDCEYLFVKECFKTKNPWDKNEEYYLMRGLGFHFCITNYMDAMYAKWDGYYEFKLWINDNMKQNLNHIHIITKDEYKSRFYEMIATVKSKTEDIFEGKYFEQA